MLAYESSCKGCTTYRPNSVTGSVLERPANAEAAPAPSPESEPELPLPAPPPRTGSGGIVYMTKPLDRPDALAGRTYKIKWQDSDHAFYITINDIEKETGRAGGRSRPLSNSKNMEAYAWAPALDTHDLGSVPARRRCLVRG